MKNLMRLMMGMIILLFSVSGCTGKKIKEEATNAPESTEITTDDIQLVMDRLDKRVFEDTIQMDTEGAYKALGYELVLAEVGQETASVSLKNDWVKGDLSEHAYHSSVVSMIYDPSFFISQFGKQLQPETADLSYSIQWLIDHKDALDQREKVMLEKAILPEDVLGVINGDGNPTTQKTTSWLTQLEEKIGGISYAEEQMVESYAFLPIGFTNKATICYKKGQVSKEQLELVKDLINAAGYKYKDIFDQYQGKLAVYISDDLSNAISSKLYTLNDLTVLEINKHLGVKDFCGVLLEEIFYEYTTDFVQTDEMNFPVEWLRDATSTWGVQYVHKNLNYEHKYIPSIYMNLESTYYLRPSKEMRSWYQYFLYVTDVLGEKNYIKDMYAYMKSHPGNYQLNDILAVGTDEAGLRKRMALFGMYLVGPDIKTGDLNLVEKMEHYEFLANVSQVGSEVQTLKLSDWMTCGLYPSGYYHVFISTNGLDPTQPINIVNDMGAEKSRKKGMAIGLTTNDKTKWVMGPDNEMALYTFQLDENPAEYIHLLIYNSDMMASGAYQYAMAVGGLDQGNGSIKVTYEESYEKAGEIGKETIVWTGDEKLEKIKIDGGSELKGLMQAMVGETYIVQEMAVDYRYEQSIKIAAKGYEEVSKGYGLYFYNNTAEASGGEVLDGLLPEMDGLTDQLNNALDQLNELPGVDMSDIGLTEEDKAMLDLDVDTATLGLNDTEISIFNQLMKASSSIQRIRYDSLADSMMLYPAVPNDFMNEPWIEGTTTIKIKDDEGKVKVTEKEFTMNPPEIFKSWFFNPDYTESDLQEIPNADALAAYGDAMPLDMKEILDKIKGISGSGNAVNVMSLNGKGVVEYDLGGFGKGGTLIQVVQFDGKVLFATYTWNDVEDGVAYTCKVELNYAFQ